MFSSALANAFANFDVFLSVELHRVILSLFLAYFLLGIKKLFASLHQL